MNGFISNNVSKSQIKKNLKKIEKIKFRLTEKYGIIFSSESTEIIVIANAGLANDVKRHELEFHLSSFMNDIKEIITPPQLTFAIIICNNCMSSIKILQNLHTFEISTPDLLLRPIVVASCIYVRHLPENITSEIMNVNGSLPPGLILMENFISVEEEQFLVEYFKNLNVIVNSNLKHRTVMHFGYEFNYDNNRSDFSKPLSENPIPECCRNLLSKLEQQTGKPYSAFNQLTVNIYVPGDGIPSHTDTHSVFTDEIVSFSLNSDIIMEWNNPDTSECCNVDLQARSVCIMSQEARYLWKHGITPRKSDLIYNSHKNHFNKRQRSYRVSLTFRQVKSTAQCNCQYPVSCDVQKREVAKFCPDKPAKLEAEFVHKVYDDIASHFSSTRHSMWPNVRKFIENQNPGSVGADIGCGNGKYFPAIIGRGFLLGTDSSFNLCKIATTLHKTDAVQSNCLQVPYKDGCCDYFISIAVLHHLSTGERRKEAMDKMVKVLRKGGRGLIYVWAQDQEKNGVKSKYLNKKSMENKPVTDGKPNPELSLPVHLNRTQFSTTDMLVPWCKKSDDSTSESGQIYTRYYHLFVQGELEDLCNTVEGTAVVESWYDSGNWATVIEKL